MKDWKDVLYESMEDKTDNFKTEKINMKGIKRNIIAQLVKFNIKPFKTVILKTGVICEHYANGIIKVI